jgi:hypothetical protein
MDDDLIVLIGDRISQIFVNGNGNIPAQSVNGYSYLSVVTRKRICASEAPSKDGLVK